MIILNFYYNYITKINSKYKFDKNTIKLDIILFIKQYIKIIKHNL